MPTVVNEMILEPKAEPAAAPPSKGGAGEKSSASGPEAERKVMEVVHRTHERALRLCVY